MKEYTPIYEVHRRKDESRRLERGGIRTDISNSESGIISSSDMIERLHRYYKSDAKTSWK